MIKLSNIRFIFGWVDEGLLQSSSLTYWDYEELSALSCRISEQRVSRLQKHIGELLRKRIPDDADYHMVIWGLTLSHAETIPGGLRTYPPPDKVMELLVRYRLRF